MKRGLNASAKSIDPGQPAQSAQADLSRYFLLLVIFCVAVDHYTLRCSVGTVAGLRTGGRWCDPRLGLYSFQGLMIVITIGFILLSPLSVVSTMVMWESSHWLGKNMVPSTGSKELQEGMDRCTDWPPRYN